MQVFDCGRLPLTTSNILVLDNFTAKLDGWSWNGIEVQHVRDRAVKIPCLDLRNYLRTDLSGVSDAIEDAWLACIKVHLFVYSNLMLIEP